MTTFFLLLVILAIAIIILFLLALFMRKNHFASTEITINTPSEKVFDFVRLLKNQEKFNKYAAKDQNRIVTETGIDGTVGYIFTWSGDRSAGKGEKEILTIDEGKEITSEIRFEKPMKTSATIVMKTIALGNNQTKVIWSNAGELPIPFNVMIPFFEKNFTKDMNESLQKLKSILENNQ